MMIMNANNIHKIIGSYVNGNYHVTIYDDGTKVRETKDDEFIPKFPECIDMNITCRCDGRCQYCYINSSTDGSHCNFNEYSKLLESIHPYTELAINGNDLSHPDLIPFLTKMKDQKVIVNMTVNQMHFERNFDFLTDLSNKGLIKGLGVSLSKPNDDFIEKIQSFDNIVIHVINGVTLAKDIFTLRNKGIKLLILGFKKVGKGLKYYHYNSSNVNMIQEYLKDNLPFILSGFDIVSFDNLALEQLDLRHYLSKEEFDKIYMGDDGAFTFYVDLVKGIYSASSLNIGKSDETFMIKDDDTVDTLFSNIRGMEP